MVHLTAVFQYELAAGHKETVAVATVHLEGWVKCGLFLLKMLEVTINTPV